MTSDEQILCLSTVRAVNSDDQPMVVS